MGEKDDSFNYDYLEIDTLLNTPIIRNDENDNLLLNA